MATPRQGRIECQLAILAAGMKRREFIALLGGVTIACLHSAQAQQSKVYRIGLLDYSPPEAGRMRLWQTFRQQLREHGYVEGQNVIFEPRSAEGHTDRLSALAAELIDRNVDVIVTAGTTAAVAAQHATTTVPIVTATGSESLALGVVGLARPGSNLTGVTTLTAELSAKRLERLREAMPKRSRFGIFWDTQSVAQGVRESEDAAQALGIALEATGVQRLEELDGALSSMAR